MGTCPKQTVMALLWKAVCNVTSKSLPGYISSTLNKHGPMKGFLAPCAQCNVTQTRGRYLDWRMWRDLKRRRLVAQNYDQKLRINAIRKNTIIPKALQEIADKEIAELPRDVHRSRINNRCVLTSKPGNVLPRWRLSRIQWRKLADYNKLYGVTRAWW